MVSQPEPSAPPSTEINEPVSSRETSPTTDTQPPVSSPSPSPSPESCDIKDSSKKSLLGIKLPSLNIGSAKNYAMKTGPKISKRLGLNKITRLLLFFFFFFFIFRIIDKIFIFFNINREIGYIYFIWAMLFFFLFVILPIRKSYLNR